MSAYMRADTRTRLDVNIFLCLFPCLLFFFLSSRMHNAANKTTVGYMIYIYIYIYIYLRTLLHARCAFVNDEHIDVFCLSLLMTVFVFLPDLASHLLPSLFALARACRGILLLLLLLFLLVLFLLHALLLLFFPSLLKPFDRAYTCIDTRMRGTRKHETRLGDRRRSP
jgi:hypothetical protein